MENNCTSVQSRGQYSSRQSQVPILASRPCLHAIFSCSAWA